MPLKSERSDFWAPVVEADFFTFNLTIMIGLMFAQKQNEIAGEYCGREKLSQAGKRPEEKTVANGVDGGNAEQSMAAKTAVLHMFPCIPGAFWRRLTELVKKFTNSLACLVRP